MLATLHELCAEQMNKVELLKQLRHRGEAARL